MMCAVYVFPLIVIAILSMVAVLYERFDDNLLQRIGLSATCVGSTLAAVAMAHGGNACNATTLLAYGIILYGAGTAMKVAKYRWQTHSQNKTS